MKRLVLLGLAAVLPWRWTYRLVCRMAERHAAATALSEACDMATACGQVSDRAAFCRLRAVYDQVDFLDLALAWTRSRRWHVRHLRHTGPHFPRHGAFLALTFHYGAGLPAMQLLGRHAKGVAWIHAPVIERRWNSLGAWLGHARIATVERLGRARAIATGGASGQARDWLDSGGAVVALVDAPHFGQRRSMALPFCGRRLGLPVGLAQLAVDTAVPVYVYAVSIAPEDGRRVLQVAGPLQPDSVDGLMGDIGRFFERMVNADPAAWHCWPLLETAFPVPAGGAPVDDGMRERT